MFSILTSQRTGNGDGGGFDDSFEDEHAATVRMTGAANVVRRRNAVMPASYALADGSDYFLVRASPRPIRRRAASTRRAPPAVMQASIAERLAWGRPYDPVAGETMAPVVPRSGIALLGRVLLAAIFIVSGFAKFTDPASTVGHMSSVGIGNPEVLVYVAGAAELLGGLALVFGFLTRLAALGLMILLVVITYYFHRFWTMPAAEVAMQQVQFMKNLAILGGLAMVVAMGPGRYSIDARLRRPKAP